MPRLAYCAALLPVLCCGAGAAPRVHMLGVWGDGMVLQHDRPLVHGCLEGLEEAAAAPPGANANGTEVYVAVHAANGTVTARASAAADAGGCFAVKLPPQPHDQSGGGERHPGATLRVAVAAAPPALPVALSATATGVLFGTVLLCGGQSNMVHPVSYDYNATAQLAALLALPNLRLFQVGRQWADATADPVPRALNCTDNGHQSPGLTPGCDVRNQWRSPAAAAASFSAVCAFTALETLTPGPAGTSAGQELGEGAAVGLVEADWGGSNMHSWVDKQRLLRAGCALAYPGPDASCLTANLDLSPTKTNDYGCLFRSVVLGTPSPPAVARS